MMPLTDKTEAQEKNDEKISGALSTEEIVSLLNKSNRDFVKESDITSNITNLFKKVTPSSLAQKNQEITSEKKEEATKDLNEVSESNDKQQKSDVIDEKKPDNEKIYTKAEAQKLANDLAKQYYNNGYKLGAKKTTEELQKGEKSLAVTLKNITDNIFKMTPEFVNELNKSITNLLSNLSKEVLGYEIDNNNKLFQEKIKQVVNSVENSIENIVVFLNPKDFEAIKVYNSKNHLGLSFEINQDAKLERGDVRIKSGSIEMSDIVSKKIKFSMPEEIEKDLEDAKLNSQK